MSGSPEMEAPPPGPPLTHPPPPAPPPPGARPPPARGLRPHPGRQPVQLDEERRGGIARVPAAEGVLDGLDRHLVDHLERRGDEAPGDDRRHRLRGPIDLVG